MSTDVAAWSLLAIVAALARSSGGLAAVERPDRGQLRAGRVPRRGGGREQPGEGRRLFDGLQRSNRLLLLPVFFTTTGLRIDLRSSVSGQLLAAGAIVVTLGTAAKVAGVLLGARRGGLAWRESFALGFLLNTKGLTELVVLRLGYDLGLITRGAFGMLVVAALVMTAATTPTLQAIGATRGAARLRPPALDDGEAAASTPP